MAHLPKFQYYSIVYHYPDGRVLTSGAYADKGLAQLNASLNQALHAEVTEIWY
jgi:hypothetical protein